MRRIAVLMGLGFIGCGTVKPPMLTQPVEARSLPGTSAAIIYGDAMSYLVETDRSIALDHKRAMVLTTDWIAYKIPKTGILEFSDVVLRWVITARPEALRVRVVCRYKGDTGGWIACRGAPEGVKELTAGIADDIEDRVLAEQTPAWVPPGWGSDRVRTNDESDADDEDSGGDDDNGPTNDD